MPLIPQFLFDLESRMRVVSDQSYFRLIANLWYGKVCVERPIQTARERLVWLLDTAQIDWTSKSGADIQFDEIVSKTKEYEVAAAAGGLTLSRNKLEDLDANGVDIASSWARQMGAYAAYWPQKIVADAIRLGTTTTSRYGAAYDDLAFFSTSHKVNPFDSSAGVYSNLHAAKPIDATNAPNVETAFANLNSAIVAVRNILMPNGEDPRMLRVTGLIVPPALRMRAQILTNARQIASASGASSAGGGSLDVEAVIRDWGIGQPIVADELSAACGGSDTSYYLAVEQMGDSEVGGLVYINREPFEIVYNNEVTSAQLARMNQLQWLTRGRNIVGYGHPFLLHKVNAT